MIFSDPKNTTRGNRKGRNLAPMCNVVRRAWRLCASGPPGGLRIVAGASASLEGEGSSNGFIRPERKRQKMGERERMGERLAAELHVPYPTGIDSFR